MKDKMITGVLLASLMFTSGGYAVEHMEVNRLNNTIGEQKKALKENSTKIANLEGVIENKDIDLKIKESAIENYIIEINGLKEDNESFEEQNEKLRKALESYKEEMAKKLATSSNTTNNTTNKPTTNKPTTANTSNKPLKTLTVNASAYTSKCNGCTGITASGYDVRNTIYYNGYRIIATDNSIIPMYSIVKIEGFSEQFIVLDRGGAIKGHKVDILFPNKSEAYKFGRKNLKLEVIRYGK